MWNEWRRCKVGLESGAGVEGAVGLGTDARSPAAAGDDAGGWDADEGDGEGEGSILNG